MALCEQCGSISIVLAQRQPLDEFLAYFNSNRPFICRRCGWRGRRDWTDRDILELTNYGAGGAEPDPELAVLDSEPAGKKRKKPKRKRPAARKAKGKSPTKEFDLGELESADRPVVQAADGESADVPSGSLPTPRSRSRRRNTSRGREIAATVAVSAFVMFLVVIVGLVGSCNSSGAETL